MKTADFIRERHACREGAKWALSISENMADVWDALVEQKKHEWLLWTLSQPGVFPDSALSRLACRFVRETPLRYGHTVWDLLIYERSRNAIEVAEAYVDGKATTDDLAAACADARDAADAAYSAALAAADAANSTAYAVYSAADAAKSAQIQMIAELGNPFKKRSDK